MASRISQTCARTSSNARTYKGFIGLAWRPRLICTSVTSWQTACTAFACTASFLDNVPPFLWKFMLPAIRRFTATTSERLQLRVEKEGSRSPTLVDVEECGPLSSPACLHRLETWAGCPWSFRRRGGG